MKSNKWIYFESARRNLGRSNENMEETFLIMLSICRLLSVTKNETTK